MDSAESRKLHRIPSVSASVMSSALRSDVAAHLRLHGAQAIDELTGDQRSKSYTATLSDLAIAK